MNRLLHADYTAHAASYSTTVQQITHTGVRVTRSLTRAHCSPQVFRTRPQWQAPPPTTHTDPRGNNVPRNEPRHDAAHTQLSDAA